MPADDGLDLAALLNALTGGEVRFLVVGGVAAVLHGAPTTTLDLDVVPRTDEENLERLEAVLTALQARVRDPAGRTVKVDRSLLASSRQLRLATVHGPMDILAELHDGRRYEDLEARSTPVFDGEMRIDVLDLDALIEIKRSSDRVRDRLQLPMLLALSAVRSEEE